ncbi:MAG: 7-cyano-7-deazaguanine synthase [Phycisphaerae bacterium]|nr:7-cyano-7-deazaguanine synthase [Phycisphaerae bacterium]MDW8263124.1 7-cyano-7-deazaguanine synthase [Phycisphaerales bacterium]
MARDLAVILNNGSINSAVTTALAAQKYRPITLYVAPVADPASNSRQAYDAQVAYFRPYREHTVAMPMLSAWPERPSQPQGPYDPRLRPKLGPQLTQLLPILAIAAGYAAQYQAAAIYLGLRVGPHNDELAQATEFCQIWTELLQHPCEQGELELIAPILELEPWQVVDLGYQLAVPFERTWSCVDESSEPCWACVRCRAREAAFQQSGRPDPLRQARRP